jgi:diadenosine tetraphosphate (Ap4A) HIT family hydrolase
MTAFTLHPRLDADTMHVGDLWLCRVLLMNDARFPWLILVPKRAGLSEPFDLEDEDEARLWREVSGTARALKRETGAFKINIAALGNQVPQLHVHVIARSEGDAAWPGPVWGVGDAVPYEDGTGAALAGRLKAALGLG